MSHHCSHPAVLPACMADSGAGWVRPGQAGAGRTIAQGCCSSSMPSFRPGLPCPTPPSLAMPSKRLPAGACMPFPCLNGIVGGRPAHGSAPAAEGAAGAGSIAEWIGRAGATEAGGPLDHKHGNLGLGQRPPLLLLLLLLLLLGWCAAAAGAAGVHACLHAARPPPPPPSPRLGSCGPSQRPSLTCLCTPASSAAQARCSAASAASTSPSWAYEGQRMTGRARQGRAGYGISVRGQGFANLRARSATCAHAGQCTAQHGAVQHSKALLQRIPPWRQLTSSAADSCAACSSASSYSSSSAREWNTRQLRCTWYCGYCTAPRSLARNCTGWWGVGSRGGGVG